MKIIGIYQITNLINNKFYIGSSLDIKSRWRIHDHELNHNKHDNSLLQNAWNKYGGDNFEFKVLELCEKENLLKAEQWWLDQTRCYEREIGYNLNKLANSVTGRKWTEDSKRRFSEKKKGTKASPETRVKMSISQKARGPAHSALLRGRKQTDDHILARVMGARKRDKWPCLYGNKCRCNICLNTRRLDQQDYRKKIRDAVDW